MERTMTCEERIRRAEEIYARRRQGDNPHNISINKEEKDESKDVKMLKKLTIQLIVCVLIYAGVYVVQNSNYIFSEQFLAKTNEILSYDINFSELYENLKSGVFFKQNNENNQQANAQDSIGGAVEAQEQEQVQQDDNQDKPNDEQANSTSNLSQEEQDILTAKNTTTYVKPIEAVVSSEFGQRETSSQKIPSNHTGIDLAAPMGTKIKAAADGEVVLSSSEGDYGNHLKIQTGDVSIIYAHCSKLYVNQSDKVTQGQEIGEVGSTGNSTGPHLHFEVRVSERTIDPRNILDF